MSAGKPTPGPWYEGRQAGRATHGQEMIASEANGKTVAVVYDADADAAFIVEACNAHDRLTSERDALREALRNVEHQLSTDSDLDDLVTRPDKYDALLVSVRAALAIADGAE